MRREIGIDKRQVQRWAMGKSEPTDQTVCRALEVLRRYQQRLERAKALDGVSASTPSAIDANPKCIILVDINGELLGASITRGFSALRAFRPVNVLPAEDAALCNDALLPQSLNNVGHDKCRLAARRA